MSAVEIGLALAFVSAGASSSSHALLKSGGDKYAMQAWTQFTGLIIALPFVLWVGLPETAILPWLAMGWVLHTAYYLTLIWSYSVSDYSAAFPIARGMIPILTTIFGIMWLGDQLNIMAISGVAAISIGIFLLSLNGGISRSGLAAAILCGVINAAFTLIDAKGMRVASNPLNFLVWFYIVDGISMPLLFAVRNKGQLRTAARADARNGFISGIFALFAFIPTLIAFRLASVGAVSAIRATSVVFSLLIGGQLLKERLDVKRISGALLVTLGAIAIIGGTALD
jgi:drug/metabolite transporter (DMT)-like permease